MNESYYTSCKPTPSPASPVSHPVIDLILARARAKSQPGARLDQCKLGLVFEGGGMRGIISAAMGLALVQLGLTDVFDVVYGSSAGALNSAYFVSRQGELGFTIYYEDINNKKFCNLNRLLIGRPAVSLDYLFNEVMTLSKPLDYQAIINSKIPLRVVASNLTKRHTTVFGSFKSRQDLYTKLRASSAIPFIAGNSVEIDGEMFSDASLYESIPYKSAIVESGLDRCTHVLVLRSRPEGVMRETPTFLEKKLIGGALRRFGVDVYLDFMRRPLHYADDLRLLAKYTNTPSSAPFIHQVALPSTAPVVSPFETHHDVLFGAASASMKAMVATLTGAEPSVVELPVGLDGFGRSINL